MIISRPSSVHISTMKESFFYIFFFVLGLCILHCDISLISLPQHFLLLSLVSSLMTSVQCLPLCLFPLVFLTSPLSLISFSFIRFDFQVDNWKSNIPLLLCAVCLSSVCIFTLLQFSTSVFAFCIIRNHEHCVRLLLLILSSESLHPEKLRSVSMTCFWEPTSVD